MLNSRPGCCHDWGGSAQGPLHEPGDYRSKTCFFGDSVNKDFCGFAGLTGCPPHSQVLTAVVIGLACSKRMDTVRESCTDMGARSVAES